MKLSQNAFATFLPSMLIFAALVACSQAPDQNGPAASNDPNVSEATPTANVAQVDQAEDVQTDNDNAPFELAALTQADMNSVKLMGELGCNFTADNSTQPMLVAQGDVASDKPAQGVAKVGDAVEQVAAAGGFDAMLKGATFVGNGFDIRVALTGSAQGGGESPPLAATLTADRADGAKRAYRGLWQCGP